jgi:hypothetical protein
MIPHFDIPFRLRGTSFAVNEQDSVDDVLAACYAVLVYQPGDRELLPEFGTPDLTFETIPVPKQPIYDAISAWEPRAEIAITSDPDRFDSMVEHVGILVSMKEGA